MLFQRKLFHKIALTTCKGVYLFDDPITYCFDSAPESEAFSESFFRKKLF